MHLLLDSVLGGFPIGSILVWETHEDIECTSYIGPIEIKSNSTGLVSYLLDGQQRVSTLLGILHFDPSRAGILNRGDWSVDWSVYFDLDTREFIREPRSGAKPKHFPMASLLSTHGFIEACRNILKNTHRGSQSIEWLNEADLLASAFRNYQIPIVSIRDANLDSAVTVFARLNRTGRKISPDQMVSALTYRKGGFQLAQELDEFQGVLAKRGFGSLDRVLLLRSVLAAIGRDIYAKEWADLMIKPEVRKRLPNGFRAAKDGISGALDFLETLGVTSDRLLPYGLQLVMLGESYRLCPNPSPRTEALLRRWFWVTSFTGWFGGVSSTHVRHALREVRDLAEGKETDFTSIDFDANALPFPKRFNLRSARVRAFMLYLSSLQPCSFMDNGKKLSPGRLLSELGTTAVAYVLPRQQSDSGLYRSPANRMFLDREFEGSVLTHLIGLNDYELESMLRSHGFPVDSIPDLRKGNSEIVIQARLDALIEGERRFMEVQQVRLPTTRAAEPLSDSDASSS